MLSLRASAVRKDDAVSSKRDAGGASRASGVTVVSNLVSSIDLGLSDVGWHSVGWDRPRMR